MKAHAHFESIEREILQLLRRAQHSVRICVAWINPAAFQRVFIELAARDVRIDLIYNDDHINRGSGVAQLRGVFPHARKARSRALMHNKFCIIDERIVITGSYNWSINAANHFENIVVIEDNFDLAHKFLHEFQDLVDLDARQLTVLCPQCRSVTFNVVVLGDERGKYAESEVDLWQVCVRNFHVQLLGVVQESFLDARLGLTDEGDLFGDDELESRESVLSRFDRERRNSEAVRRYLTWHRVTDAKGKTYQAKVHAVGQVTVDNFSEYNKGYSNFPDLVLRIGWRDRWMRQHIPDVISDGEGEISEIIEKHTGDFSFYNDV